MAPKPENRTSARSWRAMRLRVLTEEDGICWLCLKSGADTADHVIPYSEGGRDRRDNLRAAHRECNSRRGVRDAFEGCFAHDADGIRQRTAADQRKQDTAEYEPRATGWHHQPVSDCCPHPKQWTEQFVHITV